MGVSYYDFRNNTADPGALLTDAWLVHCHPATPAACANPANWASEERLTDTPFDMRAAPFADGHFTGDDEGFTATGGGFLAFSAQPHPGDPASAFACRVGP